MFLPRDLVLLLSEYTHSTYAVVRACTTLWSRYADDEAFWLAVARSMPPDGAFTTPPRFPSLEYIIPKEMGLLTDCTYEIEGGYTVRNRDVYFGNRFLYSASGRVAPHLGLYMDLSGHITDLITQDVLYSIHLTWEAWHTVMGFTRTHCVFRRGDTLRIVKYNPLSIVDLATESPWRLLEVFRTFILGVMGTVLTIWSYEGAVLWTVPCSMGMTANGGHGVVAVRGEDYVTILYDAMTGQERVRFALTWACYMGGAMFKHDGWLFRVDLSTGATVWKTPIVAAYTLGATVYFRVPRTAIYKRLLLR